VLGSIERYFFLKNETFQSLNIISFELSNKIESNIPPVSGSIIFTKFAHCNDCLKNLVLDSKLQKPSSATSIKNFLNAAKLDKDDNAAFLIWRPVLRVNF
jgi:hypothetical protein